MAKLMLDYIKGEYAICEQPSTCPLCKKNIVPILQGYFINKQNKVSSLLFSCPGCGNGFMGTYKFIREDYGKKNTYYLEYVNSHPQNPETKEFDKRILDLSKSFVRIFNQAKAAEFYGLNEICGVGYRKSLEFLIKDYCVYKFPDEKDKIKKLSLSNVIDKFIENEKIKNLSKASAWIGNDETHYNRKHEEKDLNDLKIFIDATVSFINYDLISCEATELIEK